MLDLEIPGRPYVPLLLSESELHQAGWRTDSEYDHLRHVVKMLYRQLTTARRGVVGRSRGRPRSWMYDVMWRVEDVGSITNAACLFPLPQ